MIVYGHRTSDLDLPSFLDRLRLGLNDAVSAPSHDAIVSLLVDFGEAYAALADALCPDVDDDVEAIRGWTEVMQHIAGAFCADVKSEDDRSRELLTCALRCGSELTAPVKSVTSGAAEGFAYYALYPEYYLQSAERLVENGCTGLTCIGIRHIGAPLAHVAAAAARRLGIAASVFTVRPRGHPFERHVRLSARLSRRIAECATGTVAIVDEGPGLSGSTFAAAAEAVQALGVRPSLVVLLPAWRPDPARLRSSRGRTAFETHRVIAAEHAPLLEQWREISAGTWRTDLFTDQQSVPAVHPQHERRKFRSPDGNWVARFAGLGRFGDAARRRAEALHDVGVGGHVIGLRNGLLTMEWIAGRPLTGMPQPSEAVLNAWARYLSVLRRDFTADRRARTDDLVHMAEVNLREDAQSRSGADRPPAIAAIDVLLSAIEPLLRIDESEVAVDGRMLPHEWIADGRTTLKTDALDHHADDFFPGCRDIVWDIAGLVEEFGLAPGATGYLVRHYMQAAGDRSLNRRLPAYRAAYLAYRIGYVTMAAESLADSDDGARFKTLQERYRRSLEALAHRLARGPRPRHVPARSRCGERSR